MAAGICLPPKLIDSFKQALVSGKLEPERLASMTSDQRHDLFKDIVGDGNAKFVNSQFESKMLLKNQQTGYLNWAKKLTGIKPAVRQDIVTKISRMDKFLSPEDEKMFLKDLASTRLGVTVSVREAKQIANMSHDVEQARALPRSTLDQSLKKGWQPSANDMKFGYAQHDLHDYLNNLRNDATKYRWSDIKSKNVLKGSAHIVKGVIDVTKSIGASLDDSFALRQGIKSFWTNNRLWQKQFIKSFENLGKSLIDAKKVERENQSRMMADPAFDSAIKDGLAIKTNEDAYPTTAPGKIPVFGRAFNASEVAYSSFAQNLRFAIYKKELAKGLALGRDMPETYTKNMAKMVNSLTGRGDFGKADRGVAEPLNIAFYSARFLKSNFDTLLGHPLGSGTGGTVDFLRGREGAKGVSAAQVKAATNLAKIVVGTAAIIKLANTLQPGSAETDPRSTDFGKIKVGDTRFDVSGGMGSIVVLASRLATGESKSSTTGVVTKLNSGGYGVPTEKDVLINFLTGKMSPVGGVVRDELNGQTMNNTKPTVKNEAKNLFVPMGVTNYQELKNNPHSADTLPSVFLDALGISTNTTSKSTKNDSLAPTKTMQQFQQKVGQKKFEAANKEYNTKVDDFLNKQRSMLDKLSNEQKQKDITAVKAKIQTNIYKEYGFKPTKSKPSAKDTAAKKSLLNSVK